ncbi:FAD-dependent oxidoreductase [Paenibacillus sp. MY03]|uniref:NADH dehydrogenase n=1 Tax=Paenibacillus agaridevorans TaxID=171404 RepID=A0A2R5F197_9BACL|nr:MULTISPECIES: NAD(P)/FAD-dependent oxidoreductase [Paenibacillus]OUS72722.1 FAD-dependent oxidoreductase [Paenibacillus sp. MY03]QNK56177.1 NAD(P)/FAD-dependent oxidoreductase [Paenibacillus sp. PAMC21692]GBG09973.1 NADH dehydrogenase [Paenibacillus agaridevorans]
MRNVVILGGGYGGAAIVNELIEHGLPHDVFITLVDRMPFQGLKTEYYALAAGTVSDLELRVKFPVDSRVQYAYGEITDIDMENELVYVEGHEPLSYDWLVIGLGCTDKYHGIEGAEEFSTSIQTFSACRKTYAQLNDVKPYGQVTIVGGGLSGVEVAAELRESRPDLNIRILDRGPKVLSAFPGRLQNFVADWFMEHGVEMRGHVGLTRLEQGILYDANSTGPIYTDVTVWTAGIQPVELVQRMDLPKDNQGRLILNPYHQLPDHNNVYVVGDCAALPLSPSGQAAGAQGKQIAEVLHAIWHDKTPRLGKIKLKGVLGSLGKKSGFGIMGGTPILGRVPRLVKSGVLWRSKRHLG